MHWPGMQAALREEYHYDGRLPLLQKIRCEIKSLRDHLAPTCGGHLKIIACIEDPVVIERILTHLDSNNATADAPRLPPCRAPPQGGLFD